MSGFGGIRLGSTSRGKRVAVVHRRGARWSVVVGEVGEEARVLAADMMELGAVRAFMERHRAERMVRVAPGATTIVRAVELPRGTPDEVDAAAALMAEAQLPPVVEEWRRGWGASPLGASDGNVGVLLIGWVGAPGEAELGFEASSGGESWTSEVVGVAWLASLGDEGMCAAGDREAGSIVVAAGEGGGAGGHGLVRTVREEGADAREWRRSAVEAAAEMGASLDEAEVGDRFVAIDDAGRRAIESMGGRGTREWVGDHAVGLGVLIGMARGGVGRLFEMHASRPERRVGPLETAAGWVSRPGRAVGVVAAALVLLLAGPLVFAMARDAMLGGRVERIEEAMGGTDKLQQRAAFYGALRERRWPMTKLLADISGAMPVGVQVESIVMNVGEEIAIRGKADEGKKLDAFTAKLNDSGVFSAGAPDVRRSGEGIEFDLKIRVRNASAQARGLDDFAAKSLGVRLYGEEYSEVEAASAAATEAREAERERRAARRRGSDVVFDGGDSRQAAPDPVPDPLTDDKIAKLDRTEVMKEFASRQKAASRRDIEEDVRQRLKDEVEKLKGRLREMKGGG